MLDMPSNKIIDKLLTILYKEPKKKKKKKERKKKEKTELLPYDISVRSSLNLSQSYTLPEKKSKNDPI